MTSVAFACDPDLPGAQRVEGKSYVAAWRAQPAPIPSGRHFSLEIAACAKAGGAAPELLRVDATMPEHRHGMNYRPTLKAAGAGRWQAEGLMFHMSGRWELLFELRGAAGTERLTHGVSLR